MNKLQIFKNEKFEVRTSIANNEPYFMLADVCRVLEIGNPAMAKQRLNKHGVNSTEVIDSLGRKQNATFINESNLYKLAFTSRKKEAEEFTEWVTSEVLPTIRKTGGYINGSEAMSDSEIMAKALLVAQKTIEANKEKINQLMSDNERMKPKALFADAVANSDGTILIGELAKLIKQNGYDIGQKRLFAWMRENGYLIKQKGSSYNMPTQRAMEMGLFKIKESSIIQPDGAVRLTRTVKVAGKGQQYFINKFLGEQAQQSFDLEVL